jgi:ornithine carbamoyltransferase
MNDLLRVADLEATELIELLESAIATKRDPASIRGMADGRSVAVLFEKPSLRTRFSVEAALARLGAHPIGAYDREVGLGSRESVEDAGRVLERYVDAIVIRTFEHERVEKLATAASVPVINALSDAHHPMQALADLQTVAEECCAGDVRALKSVRIAFVGDGNNVAHSLIEACALTGAAVTIAGPPGHAPDDEIVEWARTRGGEVTVTQDPIDAVTGADVVYTDVWASMGQEEEADARKRSFEPYRVGAELMSHAAKDAIFLHCLPAHRGEEVDAEVIDGGASRVFDQAENRLHTTVAVFLKVFGAG